MLSEFSEEYGFKLNTNKYCLSWQYQTYLKYVYV